MTKIKAPRSGNFYDRFFNSEQPSNVLVDQVSSSVFIVGRAKAGTKTTDFSWQISTLSIYGDVQQVEYAADGEPRFRWVDRRLVTDKDIPEDGSPAGVYLTSYEVDANSPSGTFIAEIFPRALDVGRLSYAFEIAADPSDKFDIIDGNRLVLTDTALGIDGSYTLDIRVVDEQLRQATETVEINVVSIRLSNDEIVESASVGAQIGTIIAVEGDAPVSFAITADPDNKFDIVGGALVLDADIDFETKTEHEVTIESTDALLNVRSETFTIRVLAGSTSLLSSVTRQDNQGNDALRTYPVNNVGPFGQFDEIEATYPDTDQERFEYFFGPTSLGYVLVTYTDDTKLTLSRVKYVSI